MCERRRRSTEERKRGRRSKCKEKQQSDAPEMAEQNRGQSRKRGTRPPRLFEHRHAAPHRAAVGGPSSDNHHTTKRRRPSRGHVSRQQRQKPALRLVSSSTVFFLCESVVQYGTVNTGRQRRSKWNRKRREGEVSAYKRKKKNGSEKEEKTVFLEARERC